MKRILFEWPGIAGLAIGACVLAVFLTRGSWLVYWFGGVALVIFGMVIGVTLSVSILSPRRKQ